MVVSVGMTTEIKIEMKPAPIAETITVTAASPVVDVESSKVSVTVSPEAIKNIPISRDLYDIIVTSPGVVSEGVAYRRTFSAHGSTVRGNTYAFDGVNMNDPVVMYPLTNINFDVIQEVEMVLGGHPAEIGYTDGAYVNVVTKSGGNTFSGAANFYYSSEDTTKVVFPDTQLKAMGVSKPEYATSDLDASASIGGPIIKDKLWFFANGRYLDNTYTSPFRPTTILGKEYGPFDLAHKEVMSFVKLTTQLTSSIRFMGLFNFTDIYEPYFRLDKGWNMTSEAMRVWDHERGYTGNGILTWLLDPNTFLDLRAAYVYRWFPLPMQPEAEVQNNYYFYDGYTGYRWGNARFNETYLRKRFQTSAYITRFQDNFFGLKDNHEIKAGFEFEETYGDWNWWRNNATIWYYWNGDPYYYVGALGTPHSSRGHGVIFPYIFETEADKGDKPSIIDQARRIGGFLQDSITIADRLTINAGIRYDYSYGFKPASKKGRSSEFAYLLGEYYLKPTYGINPYDEISNPAWDDVMKWSSFSPRLGITYDVFGNGKTALKASFARYTEYLMLQYFSVLHPLYPRTFSFGWWDLNGNKKLDPPPTDRYVHYGTTPEVMKFEYSKDKLDPNTKSPYTDELIVGIQHELMRDFSVGINYVYKKKKNIVEDVLYDRATGRYWYTYEQAPDWWVPFKTIIPAKDIFPAKEVTVYFPSNNAPKTVWYRMTNVPEGERKYQGVELIFNKRMSQGWMLGGSIVLSKFEGNLGGDYGSSWGWSGGYDNPNWFVNRYGRLDFDRPLLIKLYGTVTLPYKIYLSGYYNHYDGSPWGRTVTIYAPTGWASRNNVNTALMASTSVYVETPGSRRGQGVDTLDLRVEKEFDLGKYGRIGVFLDAFNVLGFNRVFIGQDDAGTYRPSDENTNEPAKLTSSGTYKQISGVEGTRMFKISIRYSF